MGMSVAAMAAAAAGLLPAVWGALLQEAIDVAVILNALRVLIPATPHARLTAADAALNSRFSREHRTIRADIEQLRAAADGLGVVAPHEAMSEVRRSHQLLVNEIGPHERAEQEQLYPVMNRVLGSSHATAVMSRMHAEIAQQTRRLGQVIDDIGTAQPDAADIADLRALLYGLHAILSLHTTEEDESYLSLGDTHSAGMTVPAAGPGTSVHREGTSVPASSAGLARSWEITASQKGV
jgi:iron-sulfur cluster repair protein YtfE (RIC family)